MHYNFSVEKKFKHKKSFRFEVNPRQDVDTLFVKLHYGLTAWNFQLRMNIN